MRKRIISVFVLSVLIAFGISAAASPSAAYPLYMIGHVDTAQDLTISVNESVLPFDLEDSVVAENPNSSVISGLLVAYYSLFSNDSTFNLVVTHSPLVLTGPKNADTQFDSIDYRLYVVTNKDNPDSSKRFKSCLSSDAPDDLNAIDANSNYILIGINDIQRNTSSMISLVDYAIYVSLEDKNRDLTYDTTAKVVENLSPGLYSSTIYFYLTGS